jgi:hypothetical protein
MSKQIAVCLPDDLVAFVTRSWLREPRAAVQMSSPARSSASDAGPSPYVTSRSWRRRVRMPIWIA